MKLAFINDIHVEKEEDSKKLQEVLHFIEKTHQPDWIIQLGDLIRANSEEKDQENYRSALKAFQGLSTPVIHTLGNHECKYLSYEWIQNLWREARIHQDLVGEIELDEYQLIWLSVSRSVLRPWNVPESSLQFLREALQKVQKPKVILSHLPLLEYNTDGSFYAHEGYFATNREEVKSILFSHPIRVIFHAHTHYIHLGEEKGTPFITLPPYLDDFEFRKLNEVYSIAEFEKKEISVKCFAKDYFYAVFHLPQKTFKIL